VFVKSIWLQLSVLSLACPPDALLFRVFPERSGSMPVPVSPGSSFFVKNFSQNAVFGPSVLLIFLHFFASSAREGNFSRGRDFGGQCAIFFLSRLLELRALVELRPHGSFSSVLPMAGDPPVDLRARLLP